MRLLLLSLVMIAAGCGRRGDRAECIICESNVFSAYAENSQTFVSNTVYTNIATEAYFAYTNSIAHPDSINARAIQDELNYCKEWYSQAYDFRMEEIAWLMQELYECHGRDRELFDQKLRVWMQAHGRDTNWIR